MEGDTGVSEGPCPQGVGSDSDNSINTWEKDPEASWGREGDTTHEVSVSTSEQWGCNSLYLTPER